MPPEARGTAQQQQQQQQQPGMPSWWYRRQSSAVARLLTPAAAIYGLITGRRMLRANGYRSALPVICVGNLTAGGTGKTPLAIHLVERLQAQGERAAFLTRGHGGRLTGPHLIEPGRDNAAATGDEPQLLARHAPTVIARDRAAGARLIESLGVSVIVMDDGLQNPGLEKDLSIAVIDARRGLGNGRVIPAGPLRAPLGLQLGVVDAIVLNSGRPNTGSTEAAAAGSILTGPAFAGPVISVSVVAQLPQSLQPGTTVVAFAGIGDPAKFFDTLHQLGLTLAATVPFADHHRFNASDSARLLRLAQQHGAQLVTTQKDQVRLTACAGLEDLCAAAIAIPITLREAGDGDALGQLLRSALVRFKSR